MNKAEDDFAMNSMFFFQKPTIQYFQWGIIKYAEEKGLLGVFANLIGGEDEDLVGGYFKSKNHFFLDGIMDEEKMIEEINGTYYKLLGYFSGILDSFQHERYKRTKRSIMDVFADVSALAMTILSIFAFVFGNYYSGNFDNYKIIEKVLSKEKKINRFVNKDISEDTNDDKKKHIELIDNNGKSEALIDSNTEGKDTIIPAKKDIEEINVNREEDRTIPKLRFIDFIMNSFYNDNCCKSSNRQQIISSCNDLVAKYYTIEDLTTIVKRSSRILNIDIEDDAAVEIARRSRGTPRIANRLLKRVRDYALVLGDGDVTLKITKLALNKLEIDELGLDEVDRKMLETMIVQYNGRPVGIEALASSMGEEIDTIEDVYEPYLMQIGFIARTPRGRVALAPAYHHMGFSYQTNMF